MWKVLENFAHGYCHRLPDRSLAADGLQCLFCYRCTGFYFSFLLTASFLIIFRQTRFDRRTFAFGWLCLLAAVADSFIDPATNARRILFGNLGGVGFALVCVPLLWSALSFRIPERFSPALPWFAAAAIIGTQACIQLAHWRATRPAVVIFSVGSAVGLVLLVFTANVLLLSRVARHKGLVLSVASLLAVLEAALFPILKAILEGIR